MVAAAVPGGIPPDMTSPLAQPSAGGERGDELVARVVEGLAGGSGALHDVPALLAEVLSAAVRVDALGLYALRPDAAGAPRLEGAWARAGAPPVDDLTAVAAAAPGPGGGRRSGPGTAAVAVTLEWNGSVVGVVAASRVGGPPFTARDEALLRRVGTPVAALLRLDEAQEEASSSKRLAAGVQHLLARGADARTMREAAAVMAQSAATVFSVATSGAYLVDERGTVVEAVSFGLEPEQAESFSRAMIGARADAGPVWRHVIGTGLPMLVSDRLDTAVRRGGFIDVMQLRSWAAIGLRCAGRDVGLVICGGRGTRAWTARDAAAAEQLAGGAALVADSVLRRAAELARLDELAYRASHDDLTGLCNRSELMRRLEGLPDSHRAALLFIDLDDFKVVNDTLGHHHGDLLLRDVSARLAGSVRDGDLLARLGGDEFAVLVRDADAATACALAQRVSTAMEDPFTLAGRLLHVRPSIGVALHPDDARDSTELMQRADAAMYAAKRAGLGTAMSAAVRSADRDPGADRCPAGAVAG